MTKPSIWSWIIKVTIFMIGLFALATILLITLLILVAIFEMIILIISIFR